MSSSSAVILVADDEEVIRKMVASIVQADGHQVLIASDGATARELSQRYHGQIHLLISDFLMPGLNGIDLAKLRLHERPAMKVLLVSGRCDQKIPQPFHFLPKPFTPDELRQRLADLLASGEK